ncbi:MAG: phage major capsid protein, partial [Deferribacterales bacterium]|nr:phage major capsid protein [Deferribacterales bacterium]
DVGIQDYLNMLSRGIPPYVVAQNIGKLSPFVRRLLANSEVEPIGTPFVSQTVTGTELTDYVELDSSLQYNVLVQKENQIADVATWYANLALTRFFVTDFEVQAFKAGNPKVLVDEVLLRANLKWIGFMKQLCTKLVGSRLSGSTENTLSFYGLKDAVSDGTAWGVTNYGNIDRTTKTYWNTPIYNVQSLWGTGLAAYQYVLRAISKYQNFASTMGMPNIAFTSFGVWQALAESFTNIERYIVGDVAQITDDREYKVVGLVVNGIPIFPDPFITDNAIFFLNTEYITFKFASGYDMAVSEWYDTTPLGVLGFTSNMYVGGQLICTAPIANFVATNMPAVSNV